MAGDIKTNDPFETSSPSLLKAGIAAAPFAAGVGIGVHRMLQDGVVSPQASAVEDTLLTVTTAPGAPPRPSYTDHLVFMNRSRYEQGLFKGIGAQHARTAWAQAVNVADVFTRAKLPTEAMKIGQMETAVVLDAITNMATHQDSITESIFRRFRKNFFA